MLVGIHIILTLVFGVIAFVFCLETSINNGGRDLSAFLSFRSSILKVSKIYGIVIICSITNYPRICKSVYFIISTFAPTWLVNPIAVWSTNCKTDLLLKVKPEIDKI